MKHAILAGKAQELRLHALEKDPLLGTVVVNAKYENAPAVVIPPQVVGDSCFSVLGASRTVNPEHLVIDTKHKRVFPSRRGWRNEGFRLCHDRYSVTKGAETIIAAKAPSLPSCQAVQDDAILR